MTELGEAAKAQARQLHEANKVLLKAPETASAYQFEMEIGWTTPSTKHATRCQA